MTSLDLFSPAVREWFTRAFGDPTPPQEAGWPAIARGENTLISASTGSGKTLAAFLWAIDRLLRDCPVGDPSGRLRTDGRSVDEPRKTRVVYVSPLKALGYDIERNLRVPLASIGGANEIRIGIRTGDTPQKERQALVRKPPDILITTPESLYLMLTSQARQTLTEVDSVILDEIHAVAGSKRGTHMALTLERLEHLVEHPIQRIGLSATQRPIEQIARFMGGISQPEGRARAVTIVEVPNAKSLDLEVVVPVADLRDPESEPDAAPMDFVAERGDTASRRSIWPSI